MIIKKFEDIIAWQKAQDLAVEIYSITEDKKIRLVEKCDEISKIIRGLIKSLSKS